MQPLAVVQPPLLIIGAGGHGRSVAEAVMASGLFRIAGFLDDALPSLEHTSPSKILGRIADLHHYVQYADSAIVAVGNNAIRKVLSDQLVAAGFQLATVIHPRAIVSPSAVIAAGCTIMAGAIIGTGAKLGSGVIVNCGAVVDHDAEVHDYGHLGVNACMSGGSVLGQGAWLQAGVALGYGVKVAAGMVLPPCSK